MNRLFVYNLIVLWCCSTVLAGVTTTVGERYSFVGEKFCNNHGQVQFALIQHSGNFLVNDIKGVGYKFNKSNTYAKVDGAWYDSDYLQAKVFREDEPLFFISNESFFRTPGNYTIIIANKNISKDAQLQLNYYSGQNTLEDGSGLSFKVYCDRIENTCSPIHLRIRSCNMTDSGFVLEFHGLADSSINPAKGIEFLLNYEVHADSVEYQLLPTDTTFLSLGNSTFVMNVPLASLIEPVSKVRLSFPVCNPKLYDTVVYRSCNVPKRIQLNNSSPSLNPVLNANQTPNVHLNTVMQPANLTNLNSTKRLILDIPIDISRLISQKRAIFSWFGFLLQKLF
ncbi:MAG: hypothetical protein V1837_02715 [Candidatus Woesearchaeota archaeon]